MAHCLGMLDNHSNCTIAGTVSNLDPVARVCGFGCKINTQGGDGLAKRVLVEFSDE